MKKHAFILLAAGLLLALAGSLLCYRNYGEKYAQSMAVGQELTAVRAKLKEAKKNQAGADVSGLQSRQGELEKQKLELERPYAYSLLVLISGLLLGMTGVAQLLRGKGTERRSDVKRLTQAALCAALCYIGFTFFKIDIPVGTEKTAIHFGNIFCVLAALLCGGLWGGLSGAVGMTIADLTTVYVTSAPRTFLLKLCIGVIVGAVAHKIFKLSREHGAKYVTCVTIGASVAGMAFNLAADPLTGYFYKTYLLGVPQDFSAALAKISAVTTGINALTTVAFASVIYLALRPVLKKSGFLTQM